MNQEWIACLNLLGSSVLYPMLGILSKLIPRFTSIQLINYRSLLTVFYSSAVVTDEECYKLENINRFRLIILSQLSALAAAIFYFSSCSLIPVWKATILLQLHTLWTALYKGISEGKINYKTVFYLFGCAIGAFCILKTEQEELDNGYLGQIMAILASFSQSASIYCFNNLKGKVSSDVVLQYSQVTGIMVCGLMIIFYPDTLVRDPSLIEILIILLFSFVNYFARVLLFKSFLVGNSTILSALTYSQVFFAFLLEVIFFNSSITLLKAFGCITLVGCLIQIVLNK